MLSVLVGAAALVVPLLGAASAQAVSARPASGTEEICIVKASPSSFVEQGLFATASSVAFIINVECRAAFSEQTVEIHSPQLNNACHGTLSWAQPPAPPSGQGESFNVTLDNNGNAEAVVWGGPSCAAGKDLIEANLTTAPFTTVTTTVTIKPPHNTLKSLHAFPARQVEDSTTSSVAVIFYAEFPSVYSERTVEFSDAQLSDRCAGGVTWYGADEVVLGHGKTVTTTLDNNGNAFVVAIAGPSCASGSTLATVDLIGPPNTTLSTTFTVLSPRVTV
jgi:hypothetical protein